MRLGKIVTLLLAGFLTFGSLHSVAATKNAQAKETRPTKKQATSATAQKTVKVKHLTQKPTAKNAVKVKRLTEKPIAAKYQAARPIGDNTQTRHFQTGVASYYANKFNGLRTASGEVFSNAKMTAAHRTLPFGTLIKVTNVRNGRSVVVRVNDRGPYAHARVLDLSSAAAKQIGMHHTGTATVKIAILHKNAAANELYALNDLD